MQAALKFESMCVDTSETLLFAGTLGGTISVIDIDSLRPISWISAHAGTIIAMNAHPTEPIIATLSMDQTASIWEYDPSGQLSQICSIILRDIQPDNDDDRQVNDFVGNSQPLGLSSTKPWLVTRTGNAGLLELDYGSGSFEIRSCKRMHDLADLIMSVYVPETNQVLSASALGHLTLSDNGELVREWQIGRSSVHWAAPISGSTFLLTSDDRRVVRLDIDGDEPPLFGDVFAGDDVEHLQYNSTTKRAFASSFDRHVYEIDPETCDATRKVFSAPFKTRWLASLERDPETLIVQCRDGSLHKAKLDNPLATKSARATPQAIWTAATSADGELVMAGEGTSLLRLRGTKIDGQSRIPYFAHSKQTLNGSLGGHTKRLVIDGQTGNVVMGRTDGNIVVANRETNVILTNVGSAVRDLTLGPNGSAYVATESGAVQQIDLASGASETVFESAAGYPVWSLAHRDSTGTLAILERFGSLHLMDTTTRTHTDAEVDLSRCKRAKWVGDSRVMFSTAQDVKELDIGTGAVREVGTWAGNTVEDFIWDPQRRWVVAISYLCKLYLFDYDTGRTLAVIRDQIDYSKGLCWLAGAVPDTAYPLDFATFGRSGTVHLYRLHDDNLVALGPALAAPTGISL